MRGWQKLSRCGWIGVLLFSLLARVGKAQPDANETIIVKAIPDFELTGTGTNPNWQKTNWIILPQRKETTTPKETKVKVLYSQTGLYFLFSCQDEFLTASKTADYEKLWLEDVVEVFLWPDPGQTIYFEYELSPLNYELPILVPNINGKQLGWRPWLYEGNRQTRHLTSVSGGKKITNSPIKSWMAEFFIPYELLAPLGNVPPQPGTEWRANMYRVDYDHQKTVHWSWQKTEKSFHEFKKFGKLVFE
ncbi:carbohydrate-binding family 9-like protein [Adhaeribacter swui]|uniref:Carbohydrate-binding family 9-like protein n=1 Tax=Adhaeribacter swui TaxID=2086471 RepID=A0A7G7G6T6_9BACT|nr:carbohydrate-binding family 9-like protein [Adhaeribacter swui]QNF32870.1 carbohydrate-binding family 9-like protein [Adhaeribacter swui]